jgi:hypothetical protein
MGEKGREGVDRGEKGFRAEGRYRTGRMREQIDRAIKGGRGGEGGGVTGEI